MILSSPFASRQFFGDITKLRERDRVQPKILGRAFRSKYAGGRKGSDCTKIRPRRKIRPSFRNN